jgi:hypothetical protein
MIIGFCGYARVGKDTAYTELVKLGKTGLRIGFADSLKADLKPCINFLKERGIDTTTDDFKESFRDMYVVWSRVSKMITGDNHVWIKRLEDSIKHVEDEDIFITDVRYHYEIDWILKKGGKVIHIKRPGYSFKNDEERTSFNLIWKKCPLLPTVINDSTKYDLAKKIWDLLEGKNGEGL